MTTQLDEKIEIAESRIKELQILIEHWKEQNKNKTDGSNG